jgi:hypothetical protein
MRSTNLLVGILVLGLSIAHLAPRGEQGSVRDTVRVHHLHFRVGDPAAALQHYADRLSGTRVILQGLGVGVRVGTHYFLFDREREQAPPASRRADAIQAAYRAAVPWLSAHGVLVQAGDFSAMPLSAFADSPPLDHLAFVAADYPGTVDLVVSKGATPLGRTSDAAMFALPDGTRIEIVRDTDAPDAYWCPMHPDVRSGTTGKCPLCTMELVPIPPPKLGEYGMDVTVLPEGRGRGLSGLRLAIREPEGGESVAEFSTVHERLLHLFIVSRDLESFAHVHPEPDGRGAFQVKQDAPPGEYVVIADFLPKKGTAQMVHRAIVTPGYRGSLFRPAPELKPDLPNSTAPSQTAAGMGNPRWSSAEKTIDGLRVRLETADLVGGRRGILRFWLFDAASGAPVTDLEPFLGAPGHMLIVNTTLTEAIHGHPEEPDARTPFVTFTPLMPAAGAYKLWAQFQRGGKVVTVPFVIAVSAP